MFRRNNNVISPVGKSDLLIVPRCRPFWENKRNIKTRTSNYSSSCPFFVVRQLVLFFVRMRSSLGKFKYLVSFRFI